MMEKFNDFISQAYADRGKNYEQEMARIDFGKFPQMINQKIEKKLFWYKALFYRTAFALSLVVLMFLAFFIIPRETPQKQVAMETNEIIYAGDIEMFSNMELYSNLDLIQDLDNLLKENKTEGEEI